MDKLSTKYLDKAIKYIHQYLQICVWIQDPQIWNKYSDHASSDTTTIYATKHGSWTPLKKYVFCQFKHINFADNARDPVRITKPKIQK